MAEDGNATPTVGVLAAEEGVPDGVSGPAAAVTAAEASQSAVPALLGADLDVVVAVGEADVCALARHRPSVPVIPVAAGPGLPSVPREAVASALERFGSDDWATVAQPLLSVGPDGDDSAETALFDAALVTAEPARISEYTLSAGGETVGTVRADGLVAATPAGTRGYAETVGTPVVEPGLDVLAVAPIAPFETDPDTWLLSDDDLSVTVERDETPVTVLADDRTVAEVGVEATVRITRNGALRTVRVPESTSPFAPDGGELEKH